MKTKLLSVLILSTVAPFSANAQNAPPEPTAAAWTATGTLTFVSQYMFRGVRLGGPSFQPAIEASNGTAGLGVWASFPFDDTVPGVSDPEIDPYGYTWTF